MAVHWIECRPDFWMPRALDCSRFPRYEDWDPELPAWTDIINVQGFGRPPRWAWGAWFAALNADRPLKMDQGLAEQIAVRMYDSKRFITLVPRWRRDLIALLTEIDDIEDQVSTIAWLAETVLAKFIPIPRSILNFSQGLRRLLDGAEQIIALGTMTRARKTELNAKRREIAAAKRGARTQLAKYIDWFRHNWGNLLEAGQATNTWFDVGIVLGPIMGYIEDGLWTAGKKTLDNYLIAADTFMPGFREAYWEQLDLYGQAIDDRWTELYEGATLITTDTIEALMRPPPAFPELTTRPLLTF